ncbi:MAG: hypothetical protein II833_02895 [Pseudobutyrivibrio sp.]|nr:hypothetical protein [Pseudobutyrivibrio sp.]MBQ7470020.1 hypothetical protein [Pseudobutyrivibrio sp.]
MKLGASDKFFYYVLSGRSTIDIICDMHFKEEFDLSVMKECADEALEYIPEFNKRINVNNGKLEASVGSGDVAFLPYDSKRIIHFGSEETNGLLFYFSYKDKFLKYSGFHGVSDGAGTVSYIKTVLYLYMQKIGMDISDEDLAYYTKNIRTAKPTASYLKDDDIYMPYEKYGDASVNPIFKSKDLSAFSIPEVPYDNSCKYTHICKAKISLKQFNESRAKSGVSLLPYVSDIVSMAIHRHFDNGSAPIILMSGVDQRPMLKADTYVNCSDSIFLSISDDVFKEDEKTRCLHIKKNMKEQLESAFHVKLAGDRAELVESFEADPSGVVAIADKLANIPSADNFNPMTMVITNMADITMGNVVDDLFEDFLIYDSARANYAIFCSFGDYMHLIVGNQNDSSKIIESIVSELRERGLEAEIYSDEHYYSDVFDFDLID